MNKTLMAGPVHLSDPVQPLEPVPNFGCNVCAALGKQRELARSIGDMASVIDANVEIRRHPHEAGK
ncbi:hypothetical protein ACFVW8_03905 [Streptomyces sp. NPDC058221]|uniref:hypothetical protein n=1 Tax=Streptomyces sp. NPDC058221 TaxID=3346388 RepID=UPI0036E49FA9